MIFAVLVASGGMVSVAGGVVAVLLEQRPSVCAQCHTLLAVKALEMLRERRQVQDLPPLRLLVREQQAYVARFVAR